MMEFSSQGVLASVSDRCLFLKKDQDPYQPTHINNVDWIAWSDHPQKLFIIQSNTLLQCHVQYPSVYPTASIDISGPVLACQPILSRRKYAVTGQSGFASSLQREVWKGPRPLVDATGCILVYPNGQISLYWKQLNKPFRHFTIDIPMDEHSDYSFHLAQVILSEENTFKVILASNHPDIGTIVITIGVDFVSKKLFIVKRVKIRISQVNLQKLKFVMALNESHFALLFHDEPSRKSVIQKWSIDESGEWKPSQLKAFEQLNPTCFHVYHRSSPLIMLGTDTGSILVLNGALNPVSLFHEFLGIIGTPQVAMIVPITRKHCRLKVVGLALSQHGTILAYAMESKSNWLSMDICNCEFGDMHIHQDSLPSITLSTLKSQLANRMSLALLNEESIDELLSLSLTMEKLYQSFSDLTLKIIEEVVGHLGQLKRTGDALPFLINVMSHKGLNRHQHANVLITHVRFITCFHQLSLCYSNNQDFEVFKKNLLSPSEKSTNHLRLDTLFYLFPLALWMKQFLLRLLSGLVFYVSCRDIQPGQETPNASFQGTLSIFFYKESRVRLIQSAYLLRMIVIELKNAIEDEKKKGKNVEFMTYVKDTLEPTDFSFARLAGLINSLGSVVDSSVQIKETDFYFQKRVDLKFSHMQPKMKAVLQLHLPKVVLGKDAETPKSSNSANHQDEILKYENSVEILLKWVGLGMPDVVDLCAIESSSSIHDVISKLKLKSGYPIKQCSTCHSKTLNSKADWVKSDIDGLYSLDESHSIAIHYSSSTLLDDYRKQNPWIGFYAEQCVCGGQWTH